MHVVQDQHQRTVPGQPAEQLPHRPVDPEPFDVTQLPGRRTGLEGGEDGGQPAEHCRLQVVAQPGHGGGQVVVQSGDEHRERHRGLELGGRALQHQVPAVVGAPAELGEQPGLADPGLTGDVQDHRLARADPVESPVDRGQLVASAHQLCPHPANGMADFPDVHPEAARALCLL